MKPVIQRDQTGCGLACVATVAGVSYQEVKKVAGQLGIEVQDSRLWSDPTYVRTLLKHYGVSTSSHRPLFTSWATVSPLALLAIKWHTINGRPLLALGRILARSRRTSRAGSQTIAEKKYPHRFWQNETQMVYGPKIQETHMNVPS